MPPPASRRRRRAPWLAGLAALAAGVTALVSFLVASGGAASDGSRPAGAAGPPPTFSVPSGYHVVYRVTAPGQTPSTEQLWVRRPFETVDETLSGPPPGGSLYLATVTRLGREVLHAGSGQPTELSVPVAPAPVDVRLDGVVGAALRSGRLALEGRAVVAGRRCRILRSGRSLRSGPLPVLRGGSSYVDSCVDADGLVLDERTVKGGRLLSDRRAVSVAVGTGPAAGGDYTLKGVPTPEDQGGGAINALTPDSLPPGRSWVLSAAPQGFAHVGKYAVEPPQPQAFAQGGFGPLGSDAAGSLVVAIDDVYVRGPDIIVIEEGETMNGARFAPASGGESVDLGVLGRGQLLLSATGTTVAAEPANGTRFVRVIGNVASDLLLQVARSLTVVDQKSSTLVRVPGVVR